MSHWMKDIIFTREEVYLSCPGPLLQQTSVKTLIRGKEGWARSTSFCLLEGCLDLQLLSILPPLHSQKKESISYNLGPRAIFITYKNPPTPNNPASFIFPSSPSCTLPSSQPYLEMVFPAVYWINTRSQTTEHRSHFKLRFGRGSVRDSGVTSWWLNSGTDWGTTKHQLPDKVKTMTAYMFLQVISIIKWNPTTSIIYQSLFGSLFACRFEIVKPQKCHFIRPAQYKYWLFWYKIHYICLFLNNSSSPQPCWEGFSN